MGNQHTSGKGPLEYTPSMMKAYPMQFHDSHSQNIKILPDKRTAKRIESFCKGICFGSRPVAINERVYIKFAEISTNWSGVLRFGFMAHDPASLNPSELPRYACPDLTNRPGFWAKALPERVAVQGNVLFFYVTKSGDCKFGVNNEEKGVFFTGIEVNNFLYPLVDIYGNTTSMEFVDGRQVYTQADGAQLQHNLSASQNSLPMAGMIQVSATPPPQQPLHQTSPGMAHARSMPNTPVSSVTVTPSAMHGASVQPPQLNTHPGHVPVIHYSSLNFTPFPFHNVTGRSIWLSTEKTMASRLVEEYCNGYVFSHRPLQCGERLVIQIMSVDRTFVGGIAFGMTACDPSSIIATELPDDSDLLLDRPEYWIVNKDVCVNPEVGDELSFCLSHDGQVVYGKNGHNVATLMHVDKTLPMWAFFDVYGNTQKIKCLGMAPVGGQQGDRSLHVSLPSSRNQSTTSLNSIGSGGASGVTPPRPPPPRTSPGSMKHSPRNSPNGPRRAATVHESSSPYPPPMLPPKQSRGPHAALPPPLPPPQPEPHMPHIDLNLPPPLIPIPPTKSTVPEPTVANLQKDPQQPATRSKSPSSNKGTSSTPTLAAVAPPCIPPRNIDKWSRKTISKSEVDISPPPGDHSQESMDNASNECCVCLEEPPNCVIYTCGHMCMCYNCAMDIKENQGAECPMCRQPIKDIIKIFRS